MNELRLKKELYSIPNIRQSILAFSELATISVLEKDEVYICTISECRYDIEETVSEFENYLIDLSYKNRR